MSLAGAARRVDLAALGREESIATAAFFDTALPPELRPVFGASFVRSHILYGEFVSRLALAVLRESGLESALAQYGSVPEIAARAALALPQAVVPLEWMLRFLAARGLVDSRADGGQQRYAAAAP